jgi:DNA-binding response OmpR family regulator
MIVDDDQDILFSIKSGLEQKNNDYEISTVKSGFECLNSLKNDKLPDLILLDILMPEMSGWEVYNLIKENDQWKDIHIVFLTARTDEIARDFGCFLADDYINKPIDIRELKKRIDKVLSHDFHCDSDL